MEVNGLSHHLSEQSSRYNWIMGLCEQCRRARAFIKSSKVKDAAAKAAKTIVATCLLCGAVIGPSASPASAEARAPIPAEYAGYGTIWEWAPPSQPVLAALGSPLADRGDSEPPHPGELDQTFPGSASTYSGTASATGVINGLPQLSTLPYSGGAVPTSRVTGSVSPTWAMLSMSPDYTQMLDLPEHARLGQLPPVVHMPTKYQTVPANPRNDRRDRGQRRGRLSSDRPERSTSRSARSRPGMA